jgi:hypothetical protein
MLCDYRSWLESELKLLGNASHHAYSSGQANMAKRAIERLDQELEGRTVVLLDRQQAVAALAALAALAGRGDADPALAGLGASLAAALGERDQP